MNKEREALIAAFVKNKSSLEAFIAKNFNNIAKSAKLSERARQDGNALYSNMDANTQEQIFKLYSKSVIIAPSGSEELALAYGNRSALLLRMAKFKDCIKDIDRALKITDSDDLIIKLLCRKTECLTALNSPENQTVLEKAKTLMKKIHEKDSSRKLLLNLVKKVEINLNVSKVHKFKNDKEAQPMKLLLETEINDSVDVRYTKKYGRHLVATRNFQPGEILFVEKLYTTCLNFNKMLTHCDYCLTFAWSGVPCDSCSWVIYCSEACKEAAFIEYHDIECSIIIPFITFFNKDFIYHNHICIRMLIMGLKEAGSITKLRNTLQLIDQCTDTHCRGFLKNGKLQKNFESLYSLSSNVIDSDEFIKECSNNAVAVLVSLARFSFVFGKNFQMKEIIDLMINEDALFLGSLLIKLCKIKQINSYSFSRSIRTCKHNNDLNTCIQNMCCTRGTCITLTGSLINHSCDANVRRCFTEDQKIVIYALQPVKVNSQIFDSYICPFYSASYLERSQFLKHYNFLCNCMACKENWPPLSGFPTEFQEGSVSNSKNLHIQTKLYKYNKELLETVENNNTHYDQETIQRLSKDISTAITYLEKPNFITYALIAALEIIFEKMYGLN